MWIEIMDRLPASDEIVPLFIMRPNIIKRGWVEMGFYRPEDEKWYFSGNDEEIRGTYKVIAWFDLPPYERSAEQLKREMGF